MSNGAQPAQAGPRLVVNDAAKVFDKPHLEPRELIAKLRKQGMVVNDETAVPYLEQVGGYRMKGYWYHWQNPETKQFHDGCHFDHVIARYEFDRKLRRITGDALERIELMMRSAITNVMSKHGGPHWFMNHDLFLPPKKPANGGAQKKTLLERMADEVEWNSRKPFIEHYREKYEQPALPPSWIISECLSFGSWSNAYQTISSVDHKKEISRRFKVEDPRIFASWLHAFSVLRNTVAHHGRLLGAQTGVTPRNYEKRGITFEQEQGRKFFVMATVIHFVCKTIKRGPRWKADLEMLFGEHPDISLEGALGFPPGWQNQPVWSAEAPRVARRAAAPMR